MRASCLTVLLAVCLFANPAHADGKVFPAVAFPSDVKIPDQSALIIWSNGVERLVIETRFIGEGTNFAWVVPLPAVPEIEPATIGLFPTLRYSFQPELLHDVYSWWAVGVFLLGLTWLLATVRRDEPRRAADLLACLLTAGGFAVASHSASIAVLGGPLMFLLLLIAANRVRGGRERVYAFLLAVLLVLILSALLLPALAGAKGRAIAAGGGELHVLDRKIVGVYDTATLEAKQANALFDWLKENGFAINANSKPVIEEYVRDGWVFVATKMHREVEGTAPATPHPLSFTFKTAKPVYPLRLTGAGSSELAVELFVVGMERARVNGFKVTECRQIDPATYGGIWQSRGVRKLKHAQFGAWTQHASVITRLDAKLTAADMRRDAEVQWQSFRGARTHVYSNQGAVLTTTNWTVPFGGLVILIVSFLAHKGTLAPRQALWGALATVVVAGAVALVVYSTLPTVSVRFQRWPGMMANVNLKRLGIQCSTTFPTNRPVTLQAAREHFNRWLADAGADTTNVLLGGLIREEDSPGNYTLHETPEGIEILGYDTTGASVPFGLIPGAKAP